MALRVIGAGFGRTGTLSLKTALERLGFERCYHMMEVFADVSRAAAWAAAARSEPVDWNAVFDGFQATVDWPACVFWPELMDAYPDAKVLLSVRDPDKWYESFADTILRVITQAMSMEFSADDPMQMQAMAQEVVINRSFGGSLGSRDEIIAAFERHNAAVKAAVPSDRLLVYQVSEGWAPLCRFLDVPVPDEPFPNVNDREFFHSMFGLSQFDEGPAIPESG